MSTPQQLLSLWIVVVLGLPLWGWSAESRTLEAEALEFARQREFMPALVECQGLWYIRMFTGNPDRIAKYDWEKSNQWMMDELKNVTFKVIPYYIAETNYVDESESKWIKEVLLKERNVEWIGEVKLEEEAGRLYSAQSRTWVNREHKVGYSVWLKKWAGQWHVIDTFRHFAFMPKLSCREIAKLKK